MKAVWSITTDDYLAICKIAMKNGKKPGEDMTQELLEYMKKKNVKPIGHTELTKDEQVADLIARGRKPMEIETNKEGKSTYKFYKKVDEDPK